MRLIIWKNIWNIWNNYCNCNGNLLFSMHSHSKYSNSHKASGEDVSHIKPGQTVEGYYDFGDVGRYAEMINNFQRVHKGMPFSKLPKALIYDASGKPYPQVFQYTHKKEILIVDELATINN